jgi:2-C-methyl-D-erythritol 4-phosphate cytidylyltransferase
MKLRKLFERAVRVKRELSHPYCAAVIVAAGTANRMGGTEKILAELGGQTVIARSVEAFERCGLVDEIVVVTRQELLEQVSRLCADYSKVRLVVVGGETRAKSVLAGLDAVSPNTRLVAVHDGARPLVSNEVLERTLHKAAKFGAAAPAIPVKDTIKVSRNGAVDDTPDRSRLYAVQTPQVFDYDLLRGAIQRAMERGDELTDDCSAVEALGMKVQLTQGSEENIKITTPLDLHLADLILKGRRKL